MRFDSEPWQRSFKAAFHRENFRDVDNRPRISLCITRTLTIDDVERAIGNEYDTYKEAPAQFKFPNDTMESTCRSCMVLIFVSFATWHDLRRPLNGYLINRRYY